MPNQENPQGPQIIDSMPGGEYTNIAQINHNEEEFQFMFANIMGGNGKVVAKLITTPGHFKRMIAAMTENLKKYEEKFGSVKQAEQNEKEIGFKGQ